MFSLKFDKEMTSGIFGETISGRPVDGDARLRVVRDQVRRFKSSKLLKLAYLALVWTRRQLSFRYAHECNTGLHHANGNCYTS